MVIFENTSTNNTKKTLEIAVNKAKELSADIMLSTTTGASATAAIDLSKDMDYTGKIIVVTRVWGMKASGENDLLPENRKILEENGVCIVTTAHTLSGFERAINGKFGGTYPVEIMAHILQMFSQGIKSVR